MQRRPTCLGIVQDVNGATISVALEKETVSGMAFIEGHGYRIGQIGSLVRIPIGFVDLFGLVSQVGAGAVPEKLIEVQPYGYRWLRIQLIGEAQRKGEFNRGISQYPTIGDEVHLVTEQDLASVYGELDAGNLISIGRLASAESISALLDADKLISRHCAVVGTTGAGKSTTVAKLLLAITDSVRHPSARVIVFDIHGEYFTALSDRATVFRVGANEKAGEKPLHIPYWALTFDELLGITPFTNIGEAERAGVMEKILELKRKSLEAAARPGVTPETLTVDSPVPFSIHRLWYELFRLVLGTHTAQGTAQTEETEAIEEDENGELLMGDMMRVIPPRYKPHTQAGQDRVFLSITPLNIRRQISALGSQLRDGRYDFLFRPGPWSPSPDRQPDKDLDELLEEWIGGKNPITILDLSGIPESILTDLVGVLIRLLFDALFWGRFLPEGGRSRPLLFVLEEAHSYLGAGSRGAAAVAAKRLVKEGRKYGMGATVISQRPSELDPTILSQCGTTVAMRISNSSDRSQVTATASENLEGLFSMLPTLRTGEAIIVGEAVKMPLRAIIEIPEKGRLPDSHDPRVYDPSSESGWNRPIHDEDYAKLLETWRGENPQKA